MHTNISSLRYTEKPYWMIKDIESKKLVKVATDCLDLILNAMSFVFRYGQKLTEKCIAVYCKLGSRTS